MSKTKKVEGETTETTPEVIQESVWTPKPNCVCINCKMLNAMKPPAKEGIFNR